MEPSRAKVARPRSRGWLEMPRHGWSSLLLTCATPCSWWILGPAAGIVPPSFFLTGWFCSGTHPACMAYAPCVCSAHTQSQHDRGHFSARSLSKAESRRSRAKGLWATALCCWTSRESTASLLFHYFQFSFCLLLAEWVLFKIVSETNSNIRKWHLRRVCWPLQASSSGLTRVPLTCTCLQ